MNRKTFLKRLERTLRIPAPGRNSFMATIEDAEFARRQSSGPTLFDPEGTLHAATALPMALPPNVDEAHHAFADEGLRIGSIAEASEELENVPAITEEAPAPILPFSLGTRLLAKHPLLSRQKSYSNRSHRLRLPLGQATRRTNLCSIRASSKSFGTTSERRRLSRLGLFPCPSPRSLNFV